MNILQKIFSEHYEEMLYILRPRQTVIENVDKMINCGDPSYGIYARHRESDKKIHRAISKEKQKFFLSFNRWRQLILLSFGYDPLVCSHCGKIMFFVELYYSHHRVPLDEMYRKVIAKYHARSPSAK